MSSAIDTYRETLKVLDESLETLETKKRTWAALPAEKRKNYESKVRAANEQFKAAQAKHTESVSKLAPEDYDVLRAEAGV